MGRARHEDDRLALDDINDFIDKTMSDGRGKKQLQYMVNHAGNIHEEQQGAKTKRWNKLWSNHEADFIKS